MVDHVASKCVEKPLYDNFVNSQLSETDAAGVAAYTVLVVEDRVLVFHTAE